MRGGAGRSTSSRDGFAFVSARHAPAPRAVAPTKPTIRNERLRAGRLRSDLGAAPTRDGARVPSWEQRRTGERLARCSFRYIGTRRFRPRRCRRSWFGWSFGRCGVARCDLRVRPVYRWSRSVPQTRQTFCRSLRRRSATDVRSDCFMRQPQRCRHQLISLLVLKGVSFGYSATDAVSRRRSSTSAGQREPLGRVIPSPLKYPRGHRGLPLDGVQSDGPPPDHGVLCSGFSLSAGATEFSEQLFRCEWDPEVR